MTRQRRASAPIQYRPHNRNKMDGFWSQRHEIRHAKKPNRPKESTSVRAICNSGGCERATSTR
ncbi:MAG TPA: hypothetical protein DEB17_02930 [Chlorobaculum sp.]|uniref:Uncharacterized protein n=1 Tax=Chlorobaculum tepidum (strain ATCC 49652 / DSM 12025 / NBRC 103806 / TLS) TaxID=194439 RepID=Q8KEA2_CHLTE|nr:hypothetical protein CT0787 [Chlorobaculum tepidum TLS]HBU22943.1 hypothetical protein [Chlorobaculum sp.]